jgi:hypothetical protein
MTRRFRTRTSTRSATSSGSSCSHARTTAQPAASSASLFLRSRAAVRASFSRHHHLFALGVVPCSGQECQKHPSTKTATRAAGKTASAWQRSPGTSAACFRNRRPRRCSADRTATSGAVSSWRWHHNDADGVVYDFFKDSARHATGIPATGERAQQAGSLSLKRLSRFRCRPSSSTPRRP